MEHPTRHLAGWTGILQADAYGGYNGVYDAAHKPAPVLSALCWSHASRKFFELADIKAAVKNGARKGRSVAEEISPIALDAVKRIDHIFEAEREITGLSAAARRDARQRQVAPMVDDLHDWMRAERARMSEPSPHGLISAVQALLGGAVTTLASALAGRLMFQTGEVRAHRRRFFGPELFWELPVAVGMAIIGEAACAWAELTSPVATGVIAALRAVQVSRPCCKCEIIGCFPMLLDESILQITVHRLRSGDDR